MPDLEDLLRSDIAGAAARATRPPEFSALLARGHRRRHRRRVATTVVACLTVVLAGAGALLGRDVLAGAPLPANPNPSPHHVDRTLDHQTPTAEQIVDGSGATVVQVAVAAADPDVRAVLWQVCYQRCRTRHAAIAVTRDGFSTRVLVPVRDGAYPFLTPAGQSAFLVGGDGRRPYLLDAAEGTRRSLPRPGPEVPVRPGEVITRWGGAGDRFVAVDPETATVHRIPLPARLQELQGDRAGRLQGLTWPAPDHAVAVVWSDDGGAGWHEHRLAWAGRSMFQLLPSADEGTMAVLAGSDGATLFPYEGVERGTSDGAAWRRFPQPSPPAWAVDGGAVLPDGRLALALVPPERSASRPEGRRAGLYVSQDADDWTHLSRLDPTTADAPRLGHQLADRLPDADLSLVGVVGTAGATAHATVYLTEGLQPGGSSDVYAVDDGGRTWTRLKVR